jgi:heme exporter protein D
VNPWIAAVIVASGLTLVVLIIAIVSSISTVKDLARSARRFQREVGGLAAEINSTAAEVGDRAGRLQPPGATRGS